MRIYSDDTVTRHQLKSLAATQTFALNEIDEKQTKQIKQLRLWVAASFVVNIVLTGLVYFLR